jgi:phosphosulfolactate synthase (CoM biosynthesis protein A)
MPEPAVTELADSCHEHDVNVSTGGFIENVLVRDNDQVEQYVEDAKRRGFDIVEISSGFLAVGTVELECMRSGLWGKATRRGRTVSWSREE